jgi:hypothetical protein
MDKQKILIHKLQMVSDVLQSDKIIESFYMFPDNMETIFQIIEELEGKIPMIKGFSKEEFKIDINLYEISNKAKDFIKYKYSCLIR